MLQQFLSGQNHLINSDRNIFYPFYTSFGPYVKHDHGPIRVLKGPQGTTHSVDPERDQNLDPKSRVQKVVPE